MSSSTAISSSFLFAGRLFLGFGLAERASFPAAGAGTS
jgi:hypothetical protein